MSTKKTVTATIANAGTTSTEVDLLGLTLVAIETPAALTGTAFTFKIAGEDKVYRDFYNPNGTAISVSALADQHIGIVPQDFVNAEYIKLVSNDTEAGERTITLILRSVP